MTADTGQVTVETLEKLLAAFNAHDLDAVTSFFVDDPVLDMPRGPHPGADGSKVARMCAQGWLAGSLPA